MSYRVPTRPDLRAVHEADRDIYGVPLPYHTPKPRKRPPQRTMHRRGDWEDMGGWEDEPGPDGGPIVRPEPDLDDTCAKPEVGPVVEVEISERDAVQMSPELAAARIRAAKVAAFTARREHRMPFWHPEDHTRTPDYVGGVLAMLKELGRLQRAQIAADVGRPPVIEVDHQASRPRFRLRWWKPDATAAKGGRWTNLGSFGDRAAAEAARTAWILTKAERLGKTVDLDLPRYLEELVPSQAQSTAVSGGFF